MMRPWKMLLLGAGLAGLAVSFVAAEEEGRDLFLLPETPPTIERTRRLPLDRPLLKKQNFVADYDVSPPPLLVDVNIPPFASAGRPVLLGLRAGSFATRAGNVACVSPHGWDMSYFLYDTEGERPLLAKSESRFGFGFDRFTGVSVRSRAGLTAEETTVAGQRHDRYGLTARADWFALPHLSLAAAAAAETAAVRGQDHNDHGSLLLSGAWQMGDRHGIYAAYAPEQDTAFDSCRDFHSAQLMYRVMPLETVVLNAGASYQKDRFFPAAEAVWLLRNAVRLSVACDPGFDKPSWAGLYASDRYVLVNRGLLYPQSTWSFREKISWYRGETAGAGLELSQGQWRDYIVWNTVAGSDYITPVNAVEEYVSAVTLSAFNRGSLFSESVSLTRNSARHLPFVPEYSGTVSLGVVVSSITVTGSYTAVSSRYYAFNDARQLDAYGDLGLRVGWKAVPGGEIFAAASNILGDDIETQPGFRRTAVYFEAGVSVAF